MNLKTDANYPSNAEFFAGKTIGITGGTGFLGQGIIEKLLRCCPDVKKIILLIRKKRNQTPEERLEALANLPAFDVLRELQPNFASKLHFLSCDLAAENLGLEQTSREILQKQCQVFIHCAATLKFNEHLRLAFEINVQCVRRLLKIFRPKRNNLQAFIHISTAYVHCNRQDTDEKLYDVGIDYLDLEGSLRWMDDDLITKVTPQLLGKRPNTYTLTKALAEDVVVREGSHLPICIVRPSMIIPAYKEPLPGWCTNVYGPTAFIIAYAKGVLRSVIVDGTITCDVIPVDFVVNGVICAAMKTACDSSERRCSLGYESDSAVSSLVESAKVEGDSSSDNESTGSFDCDQIPMVNGSVPIYHVNSGVKNGIVMERLVPLIINNVAENPSDPFRAPWVLCTKNRKLYELTTFYSQTIPAHAIDASLALMGKKRKMARLNEKIMSAMEVMEFFFTTTFQFNNENVDHLHSSLTPEDQKTYNLDCGVYQWEDYFTTYIAGCNKFILKQKNNDLQLKQKLTKLRLVEKCFYSGAALGVCGLALASGFTSSLWQLTEFIGTSLAVL